MNNIVYKIINIQTGKFLVGSTSNEVTRKNNHFSALRRHKHENKYLQRSYDKYGRNAFDFIIIKRFDIQQEMINCEQLWLDKFCGQYHLCYNINPYADKGGSFAGYIHTEESKKKISQSLKNSGSKKGKNNPCYGRIGSKNPRAKLNEIQVRIIRKCIDLNLSNTFIASLFDVKQPAISKIKWPTLAHKRGIS